MIVPYIPESLPAADAGEYATCAADLSWFPHFRLASHTLRGDPFGSSLVQSGFGRGRGRRNLATPVLLGRPHPLTTLEEDGLLRVPGENAAHEDGSLRKIFAV